MELVREGEEGVHLRSAEEGEAVEPGPGVLEVFGGLLGGAGEEAFEFALLWGKGEGRV